VKGKKAKGKRENDQQVRAQLGDGGAGPPAKCCSFNSVVKVAYFHE
jgi:hypothetical protein